MNTTGDTTTTTPRPAVTVYTTGPGCMQCKLTKAKLDAVGLAYREIDIRRNPAAAEYVSDLDAVQAPVCVVEDGTGENYWSGFQPGRIDRLTGT